MLSLGAEVLSHHGGIKGIGLLGHGADSMAQPLFSKVEGALHPLCVAGDIPVVSLPSGAMFPPCRHLLQVFFRG